MSLDVTLRTTGGKTEPRAAIFVRETGRTREVTREEWDRLYPGREPVTMMVGGDNGEVYSANITHNLNKMAEEAGIYQHLWRPDEINVDIASELIDPLTQGLIRLAADPDKFKQFNPSNGWGDYQGLVSFVAQYLDACQKFPFAVIEVSR
jgi:hypothetical protein